MHEQAAPDEQKRRLKCGAYTRQGATYVLCYEQPGGRLENERSQVTATNNREQDMATGEHTSSCLTFFRYCSSTWSLSASSPSPDILQVFFPSTPFAVFGRALCPPVYSADFHQTGVLSQLPLSVYGGRSRDRSAEKHGVLLGRNAHKIKHSSRQVDRPSSCLLLGPLRLVLRSCLLSASLACSRRKGPRKINAGAWGYHRRVPRCVGGVTSVPAVLPHTQQSRSVSHTSPSSSAGCAVLEDGNNEGFLGEHPQHGAEPYAIQPDSAGENCKRCYLYNLFLEQEAEF